MKQHQKLLRYEWEKIHIKKYNYRDKYRIYTDGSRSSEGVGASYVYYYRNREQYHKKIKLDKRCTNYQAELVAIDHAINWISQRKKNIKITICTDSQAVLKALNDGNNKSELIDNIRRNIVKSDNMLVFSWVKAHFGDQGNERADSLAKEASYLKTKESYRKISTKYIKTEIKNRYILQWQQRWEITTKGRELFEYIPDINQRLNNKHLQIGHKFTRFVTGHGDFAKYHYRFNHRDDENCEICGATACIEQLRVLSVSDLDVNDKLKV
ncbi:ribonuclease H-like [Centruroides sculpturatus]|uniref:ribonuclease H-like n=1 Tax=Centruroides sculpturatus TaxID=218467 RepID=UPI000C6E87B7|nr:ribonuclease H-like [Centruroides sculpturatus]